MKIVFMGTPDYADRILKRLLDEKEMDVAAVFTQPDRPVGRKKVLMPPLVKVTALEAGIEVHQPESLKAESVAETIRSYDPDFIVVAAYGQLLPKVILDIAPCINLHASLLPKYRGASPIQEALLHGDKVTGVTAMRMEEGLDSGPVLAWRVREIWPMTRKNELFETLADDAADLTPRVLRDFHRIAPLPQCDAEASYCKKIKKSDGLVTFEMAAEEIYNRFRAYEGWPGIFLQSGLKLLELIPFPGEGRPGEIVAVDDEGVTVACAEGAVQIFKVQPPSKKPMEAVAYIRGKRWQVGDLFL